MARPLALALLLALAACGGRSSPSIPPLVVYNEPRAVPVTCPTPPALVSGGTNPAADPGATCSRAVQSSALPAVSASVTHGLLDLGVRTVGEVVSFDVPPGTASITVVEQVVSAADSITPIFGGVRDRPQENAAVVAELRDPAGTLVFTDIRLDSPADGAGTPLFFASYSAVTGTITYPNTTASLVAAVGGVAAGQWTVQVGDFAYQCALAASATPPPALAGFSCDPAPAGATPFAEGTYQLYVLTRPSAPSGAAIPALGLVDVNLHIVDAPAPGQLIPIAAAAAPTHATARRLVESYAALLAGAGLCLGTVTFYDAPDWARTRFAAGVSDADFSACSDFAQLLAMSMPDQRTLDLFLVTRIGSGPSLTLGVDGTIPGPATVNGTGASGAMVSAESLGSGPCPAAGAPLDLVRCGADEVAYIAAHESGHYLGLYHTTEVTGGQWDPLSSTPKCADTCGTSGVAPSSCNKSSSCGGGPNLMFPLLDEDRSRGYLTGEQGQVARASPLVR